MTSYYHIDLNVSMQISPEVFSEALHKRNINNGTIERNKTAITVKQENRKKGNNLFVMCNTTISIIFRGLDLFFDEKTSGQLNLGLTLLATAF